MGFYEKLRQKKRRIRISRSFFFLKNKNVPQPEKTLKIPNLLNSAYLGFKISFKESSYLVSL